MNLKSFAGSLPDNVLKILVLAGLVGAIAMTRASHPNTAEVRIIESSSRERVFQGEVTRGMTVLDALNASVAAGGIPLQFHVDSDRERTTVLRLDGATNSEADRITFFINGRDISGDTIHQTPIRPGDQVIVKILP